MGIGEVINSLSDNPYFGAGFGLFGVGAAAAIGKKGAQVSLLALFSMVKEKMPVHNTCWKISYEKFSCILY